MNGAFACRHDDGLCDMPGTCRDAGACFSMKPYPAAALPTDSAARKETPIYSGVLKYFPLALAEVARLSKAGNDKHNPGEPLHWSRGKSNDHEDCIARHLIELGTVDPDDGFLHDVKLAWRALANLQIRLEQKVALVSVDKSKIPLDMQK